MAIGGYAARLALVVGGACAALFGGELALRQNAGVRPVWTDAQALRLAQRQLGVLSAAEATARQAVASLQQQAQSLQQQAAALQSLAQQAAAQTPFSRGDFGGEGFRDRRGDDGGGFGRGF